MAPRRPMRRHLGGQPVAGAVWRADIAAAAIFGLSILEVVGSAGLRGVDL